jgi:hypothetical protein
MNIKLPTVEGIKEFFRVIVLTVIAAIVTIAIDAAISAAAGLNMDPTLKAGLISVLTAAGKAWDKKVHADPGTKRTGWLPF